MGCIECGLSDVILDGSTLLIENAKNVTLNNIEIKDTNHDGYGALAIHRTNGTR